MSVICLDPGTTFAIATDIPAVNLRHTFKEYTRGRKALPPLKVAPGLNVMTFGLAIQDEAKKGGVEGILPKDSQPWERFREFRKIIDKFIFLANLQDLSHDPPWFIIEKTTFVRSVKQAVYALGWYAHYSEMIHSADMGFYEILTSDLKTYIFSVLKTTPEKMKRNKGNAEQIIRGYYPAVRNDHEAHAAAMLRMFQEQERRKVEG